MIYQCACEWCGCPIWMEDEYDKNDDRRCEECIVTGFCLETNENSEAVS